MEILLASFLMYVTFHITPELLLPKVVDSRATWATFQSKVKKY